MSRSHDDRKDLREGVLSSTSSRSLNLGMASQNIEKDLHEKPNFISHNSGSETSGFRTVDLIKPSKQIQSRTIAPSQLPMQSLLPGILSSPGHPLINPVPIQHGPLVRGLGPGAHAFPTHIPIGIGAAAAAVAPPRAGVSTAALRTPMPPLKPSNLANQVQIPITQFQGRSPTIFSSVVTSNRTASPVVTSSGSRTHNSDHRGTEGRGNIISDPHHIRSSAPTLGSSQSGNATIQVIASGTASQLPPSGHVAKNLAVNAPQNILKIGGPALQHSPFSQTLTTAGSPVVTTVTTFKFTTVPNSIAFGKTYPPQPPVLVPSTSAISGITRVDPLDHLEHKSVALTTSHHSPATTAVQHAPHSSSVPPSGTSHTHSSHLTHTSNVHSDARNERPHNINQPVLDYYLHGPAIARHIGMSNYSPTFHSLVRPQSGTFPMGLAQPLSLCPSIASSKGNLVSSESAFGNHNLDSHAANHASNTFPIQSLYPNLQQHPVPYSSAVTSANSNGASPRPTILKRNRDGVPVASTERMSSPVKIEPSYQTSRSAQSSPKCLSDSNNQSDSLTTSLDLIATNGKNLPSPTMSETNRDYDLKTTSSSSAMVSVAHISAVSAAILGAPMPNPLNSEASPRKKPRKQLVITTEDRFGTNTSLEENQSSDDDEESLKAKEPPLKDLTPPLKLNKHINQNRNDVKVDMKKEDQSETDDSLKYFLFRRRPRISILGDYKTNSKAAYNHFFRYSDVRPKEEKRVTNVAEIVNQKSIYVLTSGWKLHHLSAQLDDLSVLEDDVCQRMLQFQQQLPRPSKQHLSTASSNPQRKKSVDEQLRVLHELIQGNIQRCQLSIEQLGEAKQTMLKVLDHKVKVTEVVKKYRQKRPKKKLTTPS